MMADNPHAQLLETLLSDEQAALKKADFAALERLAPRKEACLIALRSQTFGADVLARLRAQSVRNQALLQAARDGLAMAQAALETLSAPRHTTTYGPNGQRENLQVQHQTLFQKF